MKKSIFGEISEIRYMREFFVMVQLQLVYILSASNSHEFFYPVFYNIDSLIWCRF
jgi:hypothetical protein